MCAAEAPQPGIYRGVPFDEYAAWPAVNASSIIGKYPVEMRDALTGSDETVTGALVRGTLIHQLVLEPESFSTDGWVEVEKTHDKSTRGRQFDWAWSSEQYKAACEEHPGKKPVPVGAEEHLREMADVVKRNPACRDVIERGGRENSELSIVWIDPRFKLLCKARLDLLIPDESIWDLKTTSERTPEKFRKTAIDRGYHAKAAWYQYGMWVLDGSPKRPQNGSSAMLDAGIIALYLPHSSRSFGPQAQLRPFAQDFLSVGWMECEAALMTLCNAIDQRQWCGFPDVEPLEPTAYLMSRVNNGEGVYGAA